MVFNNSGVVLTVFKPNEHGRHQAVVPPGGRTLGHYIHFDTFLEARGCTYTYSRTDIQAGQGWMQDYGRRPIKVQVEPDMTIHLLPSATRSVATARPLPSLHRNGFPLRVIAKVCR